MSLPYVKENVLLSLLIKGGWVMIPIFLSSILALYIIIERLISIRIASKVPKNWIRYVNEKTKQSDFRGVLTLCESHKFIAAKILGYYTHSIVSCEKVTWNLVENKVQEEVYKVEKGIPLLGVIAATAPMLGFLGTVTGMIQSFMTIANESQSVSPKLIANGIYEALITTAAGLIVGIFANLGYNYILERIDNLIRVLELTVNKFHELVKTLPGQDR